LYKREPVKQTGSFFNKKKTEYGKPIKQNFKDKKEKSIMKLVNGTVAMKEMAHEILAETIINNTTDMNGVRFACINIELIRICDEYQRPTNKAHVQELVPEFSMIYAGCLTVSYRDGWFYVIDGQHRYKAALAKGIKSLNCIIVTGLTLKQEAKMFRDLNVTSKTPTIYEIFYSNICNGDESDPDVKVDMQIKRICDDYNIEVKKFSRCSEGKKLRCLATARKIVGSTTYNGTDCFKWIIDLLNLSDWADDSSAYKDEIIATLRNFWVDNRNIDGIEKKVIKALNSTTPEKFIKKARGGKYVDYGKNVALGLYLRDLIQGKSEV
jgi:hypothetical protein